MSDAAPRRTDATEASPPPRRPGLFESGIFLDPVVRTMTFVAIGLVIVFLATVVGALASGVMVPTGPRTSAERELMRATEALKEGAVGDAWAPYIDALVATGDLGAARVALAQARASSTTDMPEPYLDLSEARLLMVEQRFADAAKSADAAMKSHKSVYDGAIAQGGTRAATMKEAGLPSAYYDAALVKAYAYVGLRRWDEAIAMFDLYIDRNKTASDILIDRGNTKVEKGDKAGAAKDFREALRYVPYDEEAKAGLKKIGASQ